MLNKKGVKKLSLAMIKLAIKDNDADFLAKDNIYYYFAELSPRQRGIINNKIDNIYKQREQLKKESIQAILTLFSL